MLGPSASLGVFAVGFVGFDLNEMKSLLDTLGAQLVGSAIVHLKRISPATYIGKGKAEEIAARCKELGAQAIVLDCELSPMQLRNLENAMEIPVVDRPGVIIEIFSQRARTKEAKTQVELARLEYLLPRLAHYWTHFGRQRGGIGLKGMGEKQIEVDRRLLKHRIQTLHSRLVSIEKERRVQRSGRSSVFKVALVGYTNAGKSTLLNALTRSAVFAENKLFATLDASVRALDPDSHPPVVAIDTVGFITRIPHSLIASFRSTLEELREADLLLHVVDASSDHAKEQFELTCQVLQELEVADKPQIVVLNKIDLVAGPKRNLAKLIAPRAPVISALNRADVEKLRQIVLEYFRSKMAVWEVVLPYSQSKIEAMVRQSGTVEKSRYLEKGTFIRVRIDDGFAKKIGLEKFRL